MAATRGAMAVSCDRNAIVSHRGVTFLNDVGRYIGVLRARHMVSFAGDIAAIEPHSRGAGFNFSAMVGAVTDANQVHHLLSELRLPVFKN